MTDVNKIKKINGKDIVVNWDNVDNKPDDLAKISDIEEQIEQIRSEIPSVEGLASEEYVDDRFEELTGAAPEALDTLEELAKALGEDANFSATIIEELGKKQNTLTFDETPIEGSSNPVISGGLFEALFSKLDCSEGYDDKIDTYTDASITLYRIQSKSDGSSITKTYYLISNSSVIDSNTIKCYQIKIQEDSILTRYNTYFGTTFSDGWSSWICFLSQTDVIDKLTDTSSTSPLSAKQGKILNDTKVDKVDGKDLSTNDFTDELKSKLDSIAENANNYTHPKTHPASMIEGFKNIYIQAEEPTDAEEGSLWIDIDDNLGTLPIAEEASF